MPALAHSTPGMEWIDYGCLGLYFLIVAGIAYWAGRSNEKSAKGFFLSGGTVGWMAVGLSLFASNISAEHFIGLAGSGAAGGVAVGQFEIIACVVLLLLGWLFVPFYKRTGVFTMPEFLERRFNAGCRSYLSAVSLIAYIFTKVSVALYAGAIVIQQVMGIQSIYLSAIILVVATGIYTIFGGLKAVIYTDFFQAFVLVAGGIILTAVAIGQVGGVAELSEQVNAVVQETKVPFWSMWRPISDPDFPWTGIIFGAPILAVWYWCTDQMIVQRTLAAKNIDEARRGTVFAGFLKLLPLFILVLPGIAGRILYPHVEPNYIYATMVNNLLSPGIKGLVVAALLAALMSSLSSVFNSSSTLAVIDFYKKFRADAGDKELVFAGRIATLGLIVVSLLWIPFVTSLSEQLYLYFQSVQGYISPPIAVVFLAGILWRRANGAAAMATLLVGAALGAARFVAELWVKAQISAAAGEKATAEMTAAAQAAVREAHPWLYGFTHVNFLHYAVFLFLVSMAVMVVVSYLTKAPTEEKLGIFKLEETAVTDTGPTSSKLTIGLSLLLLVLVAAVWIVFSPLVLAK